MKSMISVMNWKAWIRLMCHGLEQPQISIPYVQMLGVVNTEDLYS